MSSIDETMQYHLRFDGFHLSSFLSHCKFINTKQVKFEYTDKSFINICYDKFQSFSLKFLVKDAAKYLCKELSEVIPTEKDFYHNFEAFNFTKIISLKNEASALNLYGRNQIWKLSQFYLSRNENFKLDKEMVLLEYHHLKMRLIQDSDQEKLKKDSLSYVLNEPYFQTGYETVIELLKIYAALPSSNAEVERGFSCMNRIKTKLRNKLSVGRMQDLIAISLNGQPVKDWSPNESFNYWKVANDVRGLVCNDDDDNNKDNEIYE